MSWSIVVTDVPRDVDVEERLHDAVVAYFAQPSWQDPKNQPAMLESAADADLAIEAALLLVQGGMSSGRLGTDGNVTVSLSGHSNEGHGKVSGWANETITVSVNEV